MRQRLGMAAALLGDPPALMLDEPFNGMDPEGIVWMRGYLRALAAEGRAVLVFSHLMGELQDTADHLIVAGRGKVIADTRVADLIGAASGGRVTLRTTAGPEATTVLTHAGATVIPAGSDTLTISGLAAEQVITLLGEARVPFSEPRGDARRPGGRAGGVRSTPKIGSLPAGGRRREERRSGFGPVLRAEWTKFRTVRGWIIAVVVGALLMAVWGLLVANGNNVSCQAGSGASCLPHYPLGPGGEPVTDSFYFVHQKLDGSGSITVRVTSLTGRYGSGSVGSSRNPGAGTQPGLQPWSKAGIIVKASTKQGSGYAAMMVTGRHGARMQYDYTPGLAGVASAASPRWLRLTRSGDTLTGYDSADGTHWTKVGTAHLTGLPAIAQAGLFAASPDYQLVVSQSLGGGTTGSGSSVATEPSRPLRRSISPPSGSS